jgi:hypothetical protein
MAFVTLGVELSIKRGNCDNAALRHRYPVRGYMFIARRDPNLRRPGGGGGVRVVSKIGGRLSPPPNPPGGGGGGVESKF